MEFVTIGGTVKVDFRRDVKEALATLPSDAQEAFLRDLSTGLKIVVDASSFALLAGLANEGEVVSQLTSKISESIKNIRDTLKEALIRIGPPDIG